MKGILLGFLFASGLASASTLIFPKEKNNLGDYSQMVAYLEKIEIENKLEKGETFSAIKNDNFRNSEVAGAPALPMLSVLLRGRPEDIKIKINFGTQYILKNTKPFPAQIPDCRCKRDLVKVFSYDASAYKSQPEPYRLVFMGAYRGQPVTRLEVPMATYNMDDNSITLHTTLGISHNTRPIYPTSWLEEYSQRNRYLIISPTNLASGVNDYVNWRRSQGYQMNVEQVASPNNTKEAIRSLIEKHYQAGVDFVLMIGDENALPMHRVRTSFSSQTPSDHPYFTLDGSGDMIPDVFYGRIAGSTAEQVRRELSKVEEYETQSYSNNSGERKIMGIASNEGANPSDDQYIQDIEQKFVGNLSFTSQHFFQEDPNSNPTKLNQSFSEGIGWVYYMGHGDGQAWPSMYSEYTTSDMGQMNNASSVKPIVIDVACQNGRLQSTRFGSTFHNQFDSGLGKASGVVGYYGGTVDIAWHPPAIMAKGIAQSVTGSDGSPRAAFLGQALFAGQLYLATQNNNTEQLQDNWEWYHLQGDPGMSLH